MVRNFIGGFMGMLAFWMLDNVGLAAATGTVACSLGAFVVVARYQQRMTRELIQQARAHGAALQQPAARASA